MANIDLKKIDKKLVVAVIIVIIALTVGYTYTQSTADKQNVRNKATESNQDCNTSVAQADQDLSSCMYVGCNGFF